LSKIILYPLTKIFDRGITLFMKRGYIRASAHYSPKSQLAALLAAGVSERAIYTDLKAPTVSDLPQRDLCIKSLRPGDTICVVGTHRLGVNRKDLIDILKQVDAKGASVEDVELGVVITANAAKSVAQAVAVWAGELRMPSKKAARERGKLGGRPIIEPAMPKTEAAKHWYNLAITGDEALALMTEWTRPRAYREFGPRNSLRHKRDNK
jgi:DNA invertase Pin-like site-specific DNA recombinase